MKMRPICRIAALLLAVGLAGCSEKKEEPAPSKAAPAPSKPAAKPVWQVRREHAVSVCNLKQIGMAIWRYADNNKGNFPPDLNTLFKKGYLADPAVYITPADPVSRPKARGELRDENTSYVYVGKGLKNDCGQLPIAFEKVEIVNATGTCNFLYAAGNVWTCKMSAKKSNREIAEELMRKTDPGREEIKQRILDNAAAADAK